MKELIVGIVSIVAPLSVALVMFSQALGIDPGRVAAYFRERPGLMLRSLFAALVLVPAAAVAILLTMHPNPAVAVGLAILVSCPPAPLMLKSAPKSGGASAAFMASMHLCLAALAFVTVPAVLAAVSAPLGFEAEVDLGAMTWILARTILLPVGAGLVFHALLPARAERFGPMIGKVAMVGLLLVIVCALVAFHRALLDMDRWSYLVIACVGVASLAIGHILGPSEPREKTALAIECGVRHPALALTIGAMNFGKEQAVPVLVPCVITCILLAVVYLFARGRMLPGGRAARSAGASTPAS
jgi:BASS family bile acid:Na+ symporter